MSEQEKWQAAAVLFVLFVLFMAPLWSALVRDRFDKRREIEDEEWWCNADCTRLD